MNNLKAVLQQLKSEKIKERQEGLSSLRNVFARDQAVYSLDEAGDGRAWLVIYQALFTAVLNEKAACSKKNVSTKGAITGAALRRLGDTASTVRWLTERSCHRLPGKVVKPLLAHLLQTLVYQGQLYDPLALDYIKAVKTLLSFPSNLDHLDGDTWLRIVEMAFNVILGDPVRQSFADDVDAKVGSSAGMEVDDPYLYANDLSESDEDHNMPSTSTQTRKRTRKELNSTPGPSSRRAPAAKSMHSVSLEQIEFTSLLGILLRSPSTPLLSSDNPHMSSSILNRLSRFLHVYPADTSLHHDYILSLSAILSSLSLNKKREVEDFARRSWDGLLNLWGTKNKSIKESLVGVLRILYPFMLTEGDAAVHAWADGIGRLWRLLSGEVDSRWGIDGLSLESLRLEVVLQGETEECQSGVFVAQTFRAGWNFDANQALAWSVLELQADCIEKLFQHSESIHSGISVAGTSEVKRTKREDPVTSLLRSIQSASSLNARAYHLQVLLFFIDQHWLILHDTLQQDVISTLLQFVSSDDPIIQSWTFICLAAIARSDGILSSPQSSDNNPASHHTIRDSTTWDPVWTHATRRASVPIVCRAACHTAYTLLWYSKRLLTSTRVLTEIETLAKDLDLQGPAFPYESVCMFLAQCLRVASQDVRLYRMQLEEKVLSWLLDNWKLSASQINRDGDGRSRMPLYTIGDIMNLLENVCGSSRHSDLVCRIFLPECSIVKTLVDQQETRAIRDFLLYARLPPFRRHSKTSILHLDRTFDKATTASPIDVADLDVLTAPRGRERRVSAALLKSLEALVPEWEMIRDTGTHPTVEKTRRTIDNSIVALTFEIVLFCNGVHPNRRVLQSAGKLLSLVAPHLVDPRWTMDELAFLIQALVPLISNGDKMRDEDAWIAMLPPCSGSGIKLEDLKALLFDSDESRSVYALRRSFQRVFWQHADIQAAFATVSTAVRDILRAVLGQIQDDAYSAHAVDLDDRDGFGPIRTGRAPSQSVEPYGPTEPVQARFDIIDLCTSFLVLVPILQSPAGELIRDKGLEELLLNYSHDQFLIFGPVYFDRIRERLVNISPHSLDQVLDKFEDLLQKRKYSRNEKAHLLCVQFLDATSHVWLQKSVADSKIGGHVRDLCGWISRMVQERKTCSWKVRNRIIQFLDRYLAQDPHQVVWLTPSHDDNDEADESSTVLPSSLLPMFSSDEDVRVRFRAAVAQARLFSIAELTGRSALNLYEEIKGWLTTDLSSYEHMITRMLSLGNIMIVSSAVRRGPYWHLLEAAFHSSAFFRHIESILRSVSERLGFENHAQLFQAYASQVAYSIRQVIQDVLRLPPHLLGYRNRRECAEASFRAFSPTNLIAGGPEPEAIAHGQILFANHCAATHRSRLEGIRDCFGDLVGFQVVCWLDEEAFQDKSVSIDTLEELLKSKAVEIEDQFNFVEYVLQKMDAIVASVLRALGDQDFSLDGSIVNGLRFFGESTETIEVFRSLHRYQNIHDFEIHIPNLPTFSIVTVLRALHWFTVQVPISDLPATCYHVLRQLFADVQTTPLVNEQIRLMNGISIFVSIYHQIFLQDETLLHTLIHEATSLLIQFDLANASRSILEWAIQLYRSSLNVDARFPDMLIRICSLAHDYAIDTHGIGQSNLGNEFLAWVDTLAIELCQSEKVRPQVIKALSAWPCEPSPRLRSACEDVTAERLSDLLEDPRITSNKFRLARQFRDLAKENASDRDRFSRIDFWRLKQCMPTTSQLTVEDIDAFSDLMVQHLGEIYSFGGERPDQRSVRTFHLHEQELGAHNASPQRAIIHALLIMLENNDHKEVDVAYRTLHSLMSLPTSDALLLQAWTPESRRHLGLLQNYPLSPASRPVRLITELQPSEEHLDLSRDFSQWIAFITVLLADILATKDSFFAQFTGILQSDISFSNEVLPVLVHTVLQIDLTLNATYEGSAKSCISNYFSSILQSEKAHISCRRCIVDVVLHLRNFKPANTNDALAHDQWLNIDFKLLARNAVTCDAFTTALLFLELAAEHKHSLSEDAENVLFEIYTHIDEPDGFYGINSQDSHHSLMKRLHHEKRWEKAFYFHGAALEAGDSDQNHVGELLHAFHAFGFDHLALDTLRNSRAGAGCDSLSSDMSYELGWRTETWDLPDKGDAPGASLYQALRSIYRERDIHTVDAIVRRVQYGEMSRMRSLGAENMTEIREVSRNLMCLLQVKQWRGAEIQKSLREKNVHSKVWSSFAYIEDGFDFSDLESIMATRVSLIRSVRQREEREQIGDLRSPFMLDLIDIERRCLLRLSEAARKSNQLQIALNSVVRAQKLDHTPNHAVSQEFAHVLWCQQEQKLAADILRTLIRSGKDDEAIRDPQTFSRQALPLAQLGVWMSEACLEKAEDIKNYCFASASRLANEQVKNAALAPSCADIYHKFAMFAEQQYHLAVKSPDAIRLKLYLTRKTQEVKEREKAQGSQSSSAMRALNEARRQLITDQASYDAHYGAQNAYLASALEMYSRCLAASDSFDQDSLMKLCSLWFANFEDSEMRISNALNRIPSRKFVFLAHQLSARVSKSPTGVISKSQEILQTLVTRIAREHPFHILYQLYCLRPSQHVDTSRRSSSLQEPLSSQAARAAAASEIFDRLRNEPACEARVQGVEQVCDAFLEWAKYPIKSPNDGHLKRAADGYFVPEHLRLRQIKNIAVPVATAHTPLDPTLKYENCVWISHYDLTFSIAGGLNRPKINVCYGSDGEKYKQLFKGEGSDDLRQDALMEQAFELVNTILKWDGETKKRNLNIRCYTVIPLSSQAGLLEFVGNTTTLADWLERAHPRYRPTDWTTDVVRAKLKEKRSKHMRNTFAIIKAYNECEKKLKPVMRHYFTEKHKTPVDWFAMRLNYTRSVATNSIVGHVLGLGDRHTSNILIDNKSGEVVHIDLGIAFDQGKLLAIPERVPFRMTRDMVDGMGTQGTQGVFQRCAEETLRVLRKHSDVIMTVLEVFKHDPLHSWTASDLKVQRVQGTGTTEGPLNDIVSHDVHFGIHIDMSSGTAQEHADRALSSVAGKLDKAMSVEYTVRTLISNATDPSNLGQMFEGWRPWW